jgi:hypothetical protein
VSAPPDNIISLKAYRARRAIREAAHAVGVPAGLKSSSPLPILASGVYGSMPFAPVASMPYGIPANERLVGGSEDA